MATEGVSHGAVFVTEADPNLQRRLLARDGTAQAELYHRFGPALHRFAAWRLDGDQDLAEEVVVEALVDAVKNIRRFSPRRSSLSAWLHGVTRNCIQRERRRQQRRKSVPASAQVSLDAFQEVETGSDLATSITDLLAARQQVARLRAALSEVEMEVLVLRCVGELSMKEIGQTVGRSERAVETMLYRAKQKAREELGQDAE